jgi:CheY-like chemotaxis protein
MTLATILYVENDMEFLKTRGEFLKDEGYRVIPATNPGDARRLLSQGEIDLAILDIRLLNDDDEKDVSGLTLAKEMGRSIPKIILTNYPSVEAVREAFKQQLDGLPSATEFLDKKEGSGALIESVQRALGPDAVWLRKVIQAIDGTDADIKMDHQVTRKQSNINFIMASVAAGTGAVIIFWGIFLAQSGKLDVGIASTIGGAVAEAIGYLFFRRVDQANKRMDQYHQERVEGQRFQTLLQACDGLNSEQERGRCRKQVILTAAGKWLVLLESSQNLSDSVDRKNDEK